MPCAVACVILLQFLFTHCLVLQKSLVFRHLFQSLVIVGHSALVVTQVLPRHASHLISVHDKWISLYGKRCVFLRAFVVVKAYLCYCPIEVWFCQIRLDFYYLIEVLYRENIVLKIQGVATYVQHVVGVDLPKSFYRCDQQRQQHKCPQCRFGIFSFNLFNLSFSHASVSCVAFVHTTAWCASSARMSPRQSRPHAPQSSSRSVTKKQNNMF